MKNTNKIKSIICVLLVFSMLCVAEAYKME